jgi:hypothetical protein
VRSGLGMGMRNAAARAAAGRCLRTAQRSEIRDRRSEKRGRDLRRLGLTSDLRHLISAAPAAFAACSGLGAGDAREGHLVDALAPRGDEGRGTLRKAEGRGERPVILGSPNGATHRASGITW